MKTIGLIGGMSWESTVVYYREINALVKERLGGLHSAKIVLFSVDFYEIEQLQQGARWQEAGESLAAAARSLEAAGAEFLVLCTNTMHKVSHAIETSVRVPLLHIADATAQEAMSQGLRKIGLIGTRFTMEEPFYRERLERHGLTVLVPDDAEMELVHRVIYDELCLGAIRSESRAAYYAIMDRLRQRGAEAIVLGCTEVGLLVSGSDYGIPLLDTTRIHAKHAVDLALGQGSGSTC